MESSISRQKALGLTVLRTLLARADDVIDQQYCWLQCTSLVALCTIVA
jgi:hypothetical protein